MNAAEAEAHAADVFRSLGLTAPPAKTSAHAPYVDFILEPDGINVPITVRYRALVTDSVAKQLINQTRPTDATLLVVADRVTASARAILIEHGGGYLDLRGRIALRTRSIILDTEVAPTAGRADRSSALSGKAGLEVAAAVLMQPERPISVRELARELGRSPSTISEVLAAMRRENLVDATHKLSGTELFWRVADLWQSPRTNLVRLPPPNDEAAQRPLRLRLDISDGQPGWALTGTAAAAIYGVQVAFRNDQLLDFFVPDQLVVRRAVTLLGAAESVAGARASLRVAPVPAVVTKRIDRDNNPLHWPLAHPVFTALDLAQDAGRGREILETWAPDGWTRVW